MPPERYWNNASDKLFVYIYTGKSEYKRATAEEQVHQIMLERLEDAFYYILRYANPKK